MPPSSLLILLILRLGHLPNWAEPGAAGMQARPSHSAHAGLGRCGSSALAPRPSPSRECAPQSPVPSSCAQDKGPASPKRREAQPCGTKSQHHTAGRAGGKLRRGPSSPKTSGVNLLRAKRQVPPERAAPRQAPLPLPGPPGRRAPAKPRPWGRGSPGRRGELTQRRRRGRRCRG